MKKIRRLNIYTNHGIEYSQVRIPKVFHDIFSEELISIEELPDRTGVIVRPVKAVEGCTYLDQAG